MLKLQQKKVVIKFDDKSIQALYVIKIICHTVFIVTESKIHV